MIHTERRSQFFRVYESVDGELDFYVECEGNGAAEQAAHYAAQLEKPVTYLVDETERLLG